MSSQGSNQSDTDLCPICLEELDIADKNFYPCQCGYQMCRFCFHRIKEEFNSKCPNCRRPYDEKNFTFKAPDPEQLEQVKKDKKQKEKDKKSQELHVKKQLSNMRIVQRNLVYVTNLSLSMAREEVLRKQDFFGQFGKILKVVINRNNVYNADSPQGPSVSAYITFQRKEDASKAIQTISGTTIDGRTIRASFGTTKYCSYFMKGLPCLNPDCMYLHEMVDEKYYVTKEEMALGARHLLYPEGMVPKQESTKTSNRESLTASGTNLTHISSSSKLRTSADNTKVWQSSQNVPPPPPSLDPDQWPTTNSPPNISFSVPAKLSSSPRTQAPLPPSTSWYNYNFTKFQSLSRGKKGPIIEAVPSSPPHQQGVWTSMGKSVFPPPEGTNLSNAPPEIIPPNKPKQELDKPPSKSVAPIKTTIGWDVNENKSVTPTSNTSTALFSFNQPDAYDGTQRIDSPDVWNVAIPLWTPSTPNTAPVAQVEEPDQDYEWSDTAVGLVDLLLSDRERSNSLGQSKKDATQVSTNANNGTQNAAPSPRVDRSRFGFAQEFEDPEAPKQAPQPVQVAPPPPSTPPAPYQPPQAPQQSSSAPEDFFKALFPHANIKVERTQQNIPSNIQPPVINPPPSSSNTVRPQQSVSGENIWNSRFAPGIFTSSGWSESPPQPNPQSVLDYNQNPWSSNFGYQQMDSKPAYQSRDNSMLGWQNPPVQPQNVAPQPYVPPKQPFIDPAILNLGRKVDDNVPSNSWSSTPTAYRPFSLSFPQQQQQQAPPAPPGFQSVFPSNSQTSANVKSTGVSQPIISMQTGILSVAPPGFGSTPKVVENQNTSPVKNPSQDPKGIQKNKKQTMKQAAEVKKPVAEKKPQLDIEEPIEVPETSEDIDVLASESVLDDASNTAQSEELRKKERALKKKEKKKEKEKKRKEEEERIKAEEKAKAEAKAKELELKAKEAEKKVKEAQLKKAKELKEAAEQLQTPKQIPKIVSNSQPPVLEKIQISSLPESINESQTSQSSKKKKKEKKTLQKIQAVSNISSSSTNTIQVNTIHANTIQANHISVNHISVNTSSSSTIITPNTSLIATIEADLNTLLTLESMEKGIFTFGPSIPPNDEIEALEKEVENARKEVKELEDRLQELKMRNQEFPV